MTSNQLEYDEDGEKQITKLTKALTTLQHYSTQRCHICHHCSSKWSHLSPRRCRFLMSIFGPPNMWRWQYVCWIFVAVSAQYMFVFPQCAREESNQMNAVDAVGGFVRICFALKMFSETWHFDWTLHCCCCCSNTHTHTFTLHRDRQSQSQSQSRVVVEAAVNIFHLANNVNNNAN